MDVRTHVCTYLVQRRSTVRINRTDADDPAGPATSSMRSNWPVRIDVSRIHPTVGWQCMEDGWREGGNRRDPIQASAQRLPAGSSTSRGPASQERTAAPARSCIQLRWEFEEGAGPSSPSPAVNRSVRPSPREEEEGTHDVRVRRRPWRLSADCQALTISHHAHAHAHMRTVDVCTHHQHQQFLLLLAGRLLGNNMADI